MILVGPELPDITFVLFQSGGGVKDLQEDSRSTQNQSTLVYYGWFLKSLGTDDGLDENQVEVSLF
ncbi:MAG: hypothetical protein ACLU4N_14235 [Butyricimonas faecihominis]